MKYTSTRINKCVAFLISLIMILMIIPISSSADSGVIYESEINNMFSTADLTHNDKTNYGQIGSVDDVDFWTITFTSSGMVNIYLGDIPAGFDYDLYLYRSDSFGVIAYSTKTSGNYEFIQCSVRPNVKYYVKVSSKSSTVSSAYYQLRLKKYDYGVARLYGFTFDDLSTYSSIFDPFIHLENIGYDAETYLNNSAASAFSILHDGWIFLSNSHADPGFIAFRNNGVDSLLFADYSGTLTGDNRELSSLSYNALSEKRLVIYSGCKTGVTSNAYGNLVDMTISKGAHACFGWNGDVVNADMRNWLSEFFNLCETENQSVADIISMVENNLEDDPMIFNESIFEIYDGNSCYSVIV